MTAELRLTPDTMAVLVVLLRSPAVPRYGLEIVQEAGLKIGALHPTLARLEQAGWVEKFWEENTDRAGHPPRRYYQFAPGGAERARLAITAPSPSPATDSGGDR